MRSLQTPLPFRLTLGNKFSLVNEKNLAGFHSIISLKGPILLTSSKGSILITDTNTHFISVSERASDGLVHVCARQNASAEATTEGHNAPFQRLKVGKGGSHASLHKAEIPRAAKE